MSTGTYEKLSAEVLIEAYLNWYRTKQDEYWWAWVEVEEMHDNETLITLCCIKACIFKL